MNVPTSVSTAGSRRVSRSVSVSLWFHRHPITAGLVWVALALGAIECILLYYFLNSWMTLPTL
jgi:hypothetical protein